MGHLVRSYRVSIWPKAVCIYQPCKKPLLILSSRKTSAVVPGALSSLLYTVGKTGRLIGAALRVSLELDCLNLSYLRGLPLCACVFFWGRWCLFSLPLTLWADLPYQLIGHFCYYSGN